MFDADYIPPPDFLRQCMRPLLAQPDLAFAQARCDFLNARQNWVTRAQEIILDSHYAVEQPTRSWTGDFLPFNGTCGIWRREAIEAAGAAVLSLMVVGHNPGLHELALALSSEGSSVAAKTLAESFPTAAAAVFERNRQGQFKLDRFLTPRRERA
jgi:cellulose synthase/poly-beta-1,6-N-acetylglucosamine synthase-like glycosyltransferase